MSTPPKSSMSGVWATLNAMKARRQASEDATSVAKPRSLDASRKAAFAAFESAVRDEASPADLQRRLQKDDAVRAVVDAHKLRVGKHGTAREIKAVSKAVADAAGDLAVVAERLCSANETAHRIDKVGAR